MDRMQQYLKLMGYSDNVINVTDLRDIGFFDAPASIKYHGAYGGGLFDHCYEVANELVKLTEEVGLQWERPESPYIVGMYHDLCKCDNYIWDADNNKYIYNPSVIIPGHGDKSVMIAQRFISLTDEEMVCIRWHMGAYERDPKMWEYYGRAVEKYPNVLYTPKILLAIISAKCA